MAPQLPIKHLAIRVFVSSTFRDMQAERDHLVKFTFPQLRKLCESRGVTWGEVDLRWGITDEEKAEGKVLPLCLNEIHRCRPYFIGMLGERYGWVPQQIPDHLNKDQPWLAQHLQRSVTELEIVHGVLRDVQMHSHAYFYFRDPSYSEKVALENRADFVAENDGHAGNLKRLKQEIRRARDEQVCQLREPYRDPEELGQWILEDFTRLIDELFPADQKVDPLDREAADHEAFAESRARVYIGRQEYFDRLDAQAASPDQPLVILGESGLGKSALLANWAAQYRAAHPDDFLLMHFIGATPHSADWAAMLRRIMGEFKRHFGITQQIPEEPNTLRAAFANWLHMAAAQGRVVLILDALNQLEDRDGALDLVWLPPAIPPNVRIFLSTLPGRSLDDLSQRGWPTLQIKPLDRAERSHLIGEYLAQYTKALDRARAERIVTAPQTANPLYLRALLEELRVFGSHERLDERINHYLEAGTAVKLYEKILARWETDYGGDTKLVQNAMTLLWAARRGLSESELLDLLGSDGLPLPRLNWSWFYWAAESTLVNRSGLLNFFHEHIRQAVREKYLPVEKEKAVHLRLADYFGAQKLWQLKIDSVTQTDGGFQVKGRDQANLRRIDEEPWQLAMAGSWQQLSMLLADRRFLPAAWDQNSFDVRRYWTQAEASSEARMAQTYHALIERPESEPDKNHLEVVALLLNGFGHSVAALRLFSSLLQHYTAIDLVKNVLFCLRNQAPILMRLGDLDGAMAIATKEEQICRQLNDLDGLSGCLGNQGLILRESGQRDKAILLFEEQEQICRRLEDAKGLAISLNNQALVLTERCGIEKSKLSEEKQRADLEKAMALYLEEERISRQLGDLEGLEFCLGGKAMVIKMSGHLDGVMDLLKQQEKIARELGDSMGIVMSIGNQASVLKDLDSWHGAMVLHKEEERICRKIGYQRGLAISLGNQASILAEKNEIESALHLYAEQGVILEKLRDALLLAHCLDRQAALLCTQGRFEKALPLCNQKESIYRELDNQVMLALSLGQKAFVLKQLGRLDDAISLLGEQEQICRKSGNLRHLIGSLMNQAYMFEGTSQTERGQALARKAYQLAANLGDDQLLEQIKKLEGQLRAGVPKQF